MIRLKNLLTENDKDLGNWFNPDYSNYIPTSGYNYFSDGTPDQVTTQTGADGKKVKAYSFFNIPFSFTSGFSKITLSNFKWKPIGNHTIKPAGAIPTQPIVLWLHKVRTNNIDQTPTEGFNIFARKTTKGDVRYMIKIKFHIGNTADPATRKAILGTSEQKDGSETRNNLSLNHKWGTLSYDVRGKSPAGNDHYGTVTVSANAVQYYTHVFPEPATRTK